MIISAILILYLCRLIYKYSKTYKWKVTQAIVITSRINKIDDPEGVLFEPVLKYKYNVGSHEYISNNIDPQFKMFKSSFASIALKLIKKYHEGQIIKIFYYPLHPEISCIERLGFLPVIVFLSFIIMIFVLMLVALLGIVEL